MHAVYLGHHRKLADLACISQVSRLLDVQQLIPSSTGALFRSLSELMRYYHTTGMHAQPSRRRALAAAWQELLDQRFHSDGGAELVFDRVLERVAQLAQKPAQVMIKVRGLRAHIQLEAALAAVCNGVAASLVCSGAEHGSARTVRRRRSRLEARHSDTLHLHHAQPDLVRLSHRCSRGFGRMARRCYRGYAAASAEPARLCTPSCKVAGWVNCT